MNDQGNAAAKISPERLDFLFTQVKDAPAAQLASQEALDTKLLQIFAVGSVVIGLAGLAVRETVDAEGAISGLLITSVVAYVALALVSLWQIWPRYFRVTCHADVLLKDYWDTDVADIKHALIADAATSYVHNGHLLRRKAWALAAGVAALAIEVVLVGAAITVSRAA